MLKRGNPYYQGPVSDHFDGKRFYNPGGEAPLGLSALLRWQFGSEKTAWPAQVESPFPPAIPEARVEGNGLRITMVGHATMLLQVAGLNILTDPVWSKRASPFSFIGPKRVAAPGIQFEALPPIDIVIVTHNHYDHLDVETLKRLQQQHSPLFITPLGNDTLIRSAAPGARVSTMDWGDSLPVGDDVMIHCEPCNHWSARGTGDRRMALWAAFVIATPAGKIYHIGDTGYHDGINYRAVRAKHGSFRLACLPIGAYEPRWFMQAQHQNPEEAVKGMLECGAAFATGHHWGCFKLTDEGIGAPVVALNAALAQHGLDRSRFRALQIGEVFDVPLPENAN